MNWEAFAGAFATGIGVIMFWPQLIRTWRFRHHPENLSGVSVPGQIMIIVSALAWLAYAWLANAWWSAAPGLINVPVALAVIYLLMVRSSERRKASDKALKEEQKLSGESPQR